MSIDILDLVQGLCNRPQETEWIEFKLNQSQPEEIGEYISAIANAAALAGQNTGYMVWGVEDGTHRIAGTSFDPATARIGNELLEGWLNRLLEPRVNFSFIQRADDGINLVILKIPRAVSTPVRFKGVEFIRVGSYRKKLSDQPEKERALWRIFDRLSFEDHFAVEDETSDRVLRLLDYPAYFNLLQLPLPEGRSAILDSLSADGLISASDTGRWNITNLGAVLFASRLDDFPTLARKAVRVIQYRGASRVETIREQTVAKGYANGFESLIIYINSLLPTNEIIGKALRRVVPMYPELAIRELVANALIHQDFSITGAGPTVEIFDTRMEITNPGRPLVSPERFLDTPPRSRNEKSAALMRRLGVCEERGSGIDKVVFEVEFFQLPAPAFEIAGDNTRAVLFSHRTLTQMDKEEKIRACYQHACLKYVSREAMTNSTVRKRFGIEDQNIAQASRLIKDAVTDHKILAYDETAAPKLMRYIPWWARGEEE